MLSVKEIGLLKSIIKHCNKINEKMVGLTREDLDTNEDVLQIICFNIMQIGELAKNFEPAFIQKYDKEPWAQIKKMRDKVAHGYGSIDTDRVWKPALNDIYPLLYYCEEILQENEESATSEESKKV